MLSWKDIVIYGLSKEYPRDIVSQIVSFLHRESISQKVEKRCIQSKSKVQFQELDKTNPVDFFFYNLVRCEKV